MANSDLDFYGLTTNEWIGMVLPYESQKNQVDGDAGFGYRYRVAIMGNHPSDNTIKDEDIVFATTALGVTDGSGAGNRQKKPALSQGDVVMGKFLDGDRKQNPIITNVLGRTEGIKYGKGRFQSKTGFVGSTKANNLFNRQESSEATGICSPKAISPPKSKNKPNIAGLLKNGLPEIPTVGALGELASTASDQLASSLEGVTDQLEGVTDQLEGQLEGVTDQLEGQLSDQLGGITDQLGGQFDGQLGGQFDGQLGGVTDQLGGIGDLPTPGLPAPTTNLTLAELRARTAARQDAGPQVGDILDVSDDIVRSGERTPITGAINAANPRVPPPKPPSRENYGDDAAWEDAMSASREEIMDSFELQ